MTLLKRLQG